MQADRPRVRFRFRKSGDLRWIGHLDLMRALERLFRRGRTPIAFSGGFHPTPRINVPSALALGVVGENEVLEIELSERVEPSELLARLRPLAPPGLELLSAEATPPSARKPVVVQASYEASLPDGVAPSVQATVERLERSPSIPIQREKPPKTLELRDSLVHLSVAGDRLRFTLQIHPQQSVRPREVLSVVGMADLEQRGGVLRRTDVETAS